MLDPKNLQEELERFYKHVKKQSRTNLTKKGKNSSKKLYNSMDFNIKVSKNSLDTNFVMEDYGKFLDKGVRGAGGVRKTTSKFNKGNNKGKLWKIKAKNSQYKFGKSGGISPKHFTTWARSKGLSPFAVAKAVYHQGIETTLFFTKPFEAAFKTLPDELIEAYGLDVDDFMEFVLKDN